MEHAEAEQRVLELSTEIERHNHLYYVEARPEITDQAFDALLRELADLETTFPDLADPNSPTQRVGGDITKNFPVVAHRYPMLSLSNSYSREDVAEFVARVEKAIGQVTFVMELKYDGVAISLSYRNGRLHQAVTRGDGEKGEVITANVRTVRSIPLVLKGSDLPPELEVRGEIIFTRDRFEKLNALRAEAGEELYANPRNTAAGTLKLQDPKEVARRGLDNFIYGVQSEQLATRSHFAMIEQAGRWGFKTPDPTKRFIEKAESVEGIMAFIDHWDTKRHALEMATDGVVIKVDDRHIQEELGMTAKSPRWAIAFKFQAEQALTRLNAVSYQVGRTGAVTPVAELTPVQLSGTTVKRASLFNADQIARLGLHIGDTVRVEKAGEIIPQVVGVEVASRAPDAEPVIFPEHCPECGVALVRLEGEAQHYCPNEQCCPAQVLGRIEHFVSRRAMDIDGIGTETVQELVKRDLIHGIADLYSLKDKGAVHLIARLGEGWKESRVNRLLQGIEASKQMPFDRVLFALGIRHIGETISKKVTRSIGSMDKLLAMSKEELTAIDEVGEVVAESLHAFFAAPKNREVVDKLKAAGLQFEAEARPEAGDQLKDLTFVVSGVFENFSRDSIKEAIESHGGKVSGSISKKTSFVLAGADMGPAKRTKADELGVPVIDEKEFIRMIGKG